MHIEWSLYVWSCRMTLSVDTNSKCGNSHELFLFLSRHNHTASHILTKNCSDIIITARNEVGARFYFTGVCDSVHGGGGGVSARGGPGVGVCLLQGRPGGDPPGRLLLRAVRILLECILVLQIKP